ncbi:tellurite resistance TerB family protein [Pontivivens ytuae]|uniref:Tellurite resistance TerB family protein n=1 Tax=Pontivivens ytuae TaxID=2789856 RepID=A0A7S9QE21_9RHOB|nr:tellurite resistance TerB family protein [Pontivivens ytuae]QPH55490.1 tellurite resistance TerB family protein [Pontivivens ytuae]
MSAQLSAQDALVATMIATSAADGQLSDAELDSIRRMIAVLPVFDGYDPKQVGSVAQTVFDLFEEEDGLDALVGLVKDALPGTLNETAYALACDVSAADGTVQMEELRLLEILRHDLEVDRLTSSAIERGARARHARLPA